MYNQASNRGINVFHMSFRFVTNHIVFNFHAKPNEWDYSEELQVPAAPAFVKDAEHALQIVCSSSGWIVNYTFTYSFIYLFLYLSINNKRYQ